MNPMYDRYSKVYHDNLKIPEENRIPHERMKAICKELDAFFKQKCAEMDIEYEATAIPSVWGFLNEHPTYFFFRAVEDESGRRYAKLLCHPRNSKETDRHMDGILPPRSSGKILFSFIFRVVRKREGQTVEDYIADNLMPIRGLKLDP